VKRFLAVTLAILSVAIVTLQVHSAEAATTRNFTLYGSTLHGWGFTAANITLPGPTILVEQGDNVSLTLISNDGITHRFFVSYTNATTPSSGDPQSADFSGTTNFNFTATSTVGTYTYLCYYHPSTMWGYFQVVQTGTISEFQLLAMLMLLFISTGIVVLVRRKIRQS
jgi:FtsP/CotA-like multicopper oxidase with cupredoxin domain